MLRITQNTQAGSAKSYYSTADYYSEGQELTGRWRGEGARRLGLAGDIKQADWDALCDNKTPDGNRLTARQRADRTVGYDFNFHVPKSVSLLYSMTRDDRILDAFRDAVDGTMHDMEEEMSARVRKNGKNENRTTGNMVWGEFVHCTSRPVGGVPDPHLHAHCFVFNTTFDKHEEKWKAGQFRELKRDAPYFEAVFHSRLTHRLNDLGLPIERTKKGWELGGVTKGLVGKFSRRTEQIEEKARELGIDDAEAKSELGAKTRERKAKNLTMDELCGAWRGRMTDKEIETLEKLGERIGGDAEPADNSAAARAIEYATSHVFERKSVVAERELLAVALKQSVGKATVEEVKRQVDVSGLIIGDRDGRRMATTRDVLEEEQRVISFARKGQGACKPFVKELSDFNRDWLNDGQKKAVKHVVESRDRIMVIRGAAGSGKTTLLEEAREAIEASGSKVFAFAPSTTASDVLRDAGFKGATTVASLLVDERLQQKAKGQLWLIDEASLLGIKQMDHVFSLAGKLDGRVLLVGDKRQHGSVDRGSPLRQLEIEAGIKPAEVKEIQRQRGAYKEAVKALAEGDVAEGLKKLDALGWIKEIPNEERYHQMAADYVDAVMAGKKAICISPTHVGCDLVAAEARDILKEKGRLGADERTFTMLENANLTEAERRDIVNYAPDDVLVFHQNAKGFTKGDRIVVGDEYLPLEEAKRFQLFHATTLKLAPGDLVRMTRNGTSADGEHKLVNGAIYQVKGFDDDGNIVLKNGWTIDRDWGHLDYAYCVTSQNSQGRTLDEVFVAQGSEAYAASSREQFYVSASRAKQKVAFYVEDKEEFLDAVSQSDERLTAMELVSGISQRLGERLRQQYHEFAGSGRRREREGIGHER